MTFSLRRIALAFLTSVGLALPAAATNFSTDYTDLWYNPAEDGWGLNLSQQGAIMFGTLFVYGTDQTPRWYVASALVASSTTSFTGQLFRTTGPYFGQAWTSRGPVTPVGTMTLNFNTPSTATLTYSVTEGGTVTVTKQIQRQTFAANNLGGRFLGGLVANATNCSTTAILVFDNFNALHSNSNQVSIPVTFFNNGTVQTCTFSGTYTQAGKLGNVAGNWSCTTGNTGNFTISQIDVVPTGWSGRFNGNDQFCSYNGFFGGVKDVIN